MTTLSHDTAAELAARSVMQGPMWDDLARVSTWYSWPDLRSRFLNAISAEFARWIAPDQPHFHEQLVFALGRFDEGAGIARYFELAGHPPGPLNVLDIGAGNGGVAFALANCRHFVMHTLDVVPNHALVSLRGALQLPVRSVVALGERIPLATSSFDVVLLLDTLEHLSVPRAVAAEIMRILRPGGVCMVTTPPRFRHLFARDPHYGLPGLVLFPNAVQRFIVNDLVRRRVQTEAGEPSPAYDVTHIYWHVREVSRLFPGPKRVDVLYNRTYQPPPFSWWLVKKPRLAAEWLSYQVREFSWDRILIYKGS